jgi:hypothetical protein
MFLPLAKLAAWIALLSVTFWAGCVLLLGSGYTAVAKVLSPDRRLAVFEFRSYQDGAGHAPYGTSLSLSSKATISSREEGDVMFAGYCRSPMGVRWISAKAIEIVCMTAEPHMVRTQALRIRGIDIDLQFKSPDLAR